MCNAMRTDDESTDGYYIVQRTSEPYTLQEDKDMKGCISPVIYYADKFVTDAVFLNPVPNATYWLTPMNKKTEI